jgi:hypothetical protein
MFPGFSLALARKAAAAGGNPGAIQCKPRLSQRCRKTVSHKPHTVAFQKPLASQLTERAGDGHPIQCLPTFVVAQLTIGALKVATWDEASYLLGTLVLDQSQERLRVQLRFWLSLEI